MELEILVRYGVGKADMDPFSDLEEEILGGCHGEGGYGYWKVRYKVMIEGELVCVNAYALFGLLLHKPEP